jgi:hypothetical protein
MLAQRLVAKPVPNNSSSEALVALDRLVLKILSFAYVELLILFKQLLKLLEPPLLSWARASEWLKRHDVLALHFDEASILDDLFVVYHLQAFQSGVHG